MLSNYAISMMLKRKREPLSLSTFQRNGRVVLESPRYPPYGVDPDFLV